MPTRLESLRNRPTSQPGQRLELWLERHATPNADLITFEDSEARITGTVQRSYWQRPKAAARLQALKVGAIIAAIVGLPLLIFGGMAASDRPGELASIIMICVVMALFWGPPAGLIAYRVARRPKVGRLATLFDDDAADQPRYTMTHTHWHLPGSHTRVDDHQGWVWGQVTRHALEPFWLVEPARPTSQPWLIRPKRALLALLALGLQRGLAVVAALFVVVALVLKAVVPWIGDLLAITHDRLASAKPPLLVLTHPHHVTTWGTIRLEAGASMAHIDAQADAIDDPLALVAIVASLLLEVGRRYDE